MVEGYSLENNTISEEQECTVGVNIASFLPAVVFKRGCIRISQELASRGFDFLSVLPIRGMKGGTELSLPIWFVDNAWNPTESKGVAGLLEVIRGIMYDDPLAPQLQDWIGFSNREITERVYEDLLLNHANAPTAVVHHFEDVDNIRYLRDVRYLGNGTSIKVLIEVHPGLGFGARDVLSRVIDSQDITGVVFDTKHARRGLGPDELARMRSLHRQPVKKAQDAWEKTLKVLHNCIRLVDLQAATQQELLKTLDGTDTLLAEMVTALKEGGYSGPVRVEVSLDMLNQLNPSSILDVVTDVKDYLESELFRNPS